MAGAMGALRGRRPSSGVLEALHVRIWIILLGDLLDDLARVSSWGRCRTGSMADTWFCWIALYELKAFEPLTKENACVLELLF